jgi:5'-deoxynucleotidase YfbR-like HD superfamily hydrolase
MDQKENQVTALTIDMPTNCNWTERLEILYFAGHVRRLHACPVLCEHPVSSHVYGSLLVATELCRLNGLDDAKTLRVFRALLVHDADEVENGDVPAPTKRKSPLIAAALRQLEGEFHEGLGTTTDVEIDGLILDVVKACDTIDLMFKCVHERRMGNGHYQLAKVFRNISRYIKEQMHVEGVELIVEMVTNQWIQAGGIL